MNTTSRLLSASVIALAAALLAGCAVADAAPSTPTAPRAEVLADYPTLTLTAPATTDAGTSPVFTWEAVDAAAEYRLAVVSAAGPVWAWAGVDEAVRYGGYAEAPADGVGALRLTAPLWWSVAAFDADGTLLAISDQRAVSPNDSVPEPLGGVSATEHDAPAPLESACDLFGDAEAEAFLEGPLAGPGEGGVEANGVTLYCSWERADDEFLTLDISIQPGVTRERWDESMQIMLESDPNMPHAFDGVGDDSYMNVDWGGTRLALIDGDVYLSVTSGFTGGAEDATIALAKDLLTRYLDRVK